MDSAKLLPGRGFTIKYAAAEPQYKNAVRKAVRAMATTGKGSSSKLLAKFVVGKTRIIQTKPTKMLDMLSDHNAVAKEIRGLTAMCSAPLRNVPDNVIAMNENEQPGKYATMKRKGGVRNAPDARRMYQEALMVRKVKAYLENVNNNIITDEEILNRMSVELEPPSSKLSMIPSTSSLRSGGRPPSPTPSRSSNLSEGKKSIASGTG